MSRVPPNNVEAEQSVLGALMLDNAAIPQVRDLLTPQAFYKPSHGKIYEAILKLSERGEPADLVTITEELRTRGELDGCGGPMYLTGLADGAGVSAYATNYARIVADKYTRRRFIEAGQMVQQFAYDEALELEHVLDKGQAAVVNVARGGVSADTFIGMNVVAGEVSELLERLKDAPDGLVGYTFGLSALDRLTGGAQGGQFIVEAGRPGMGKTARALKNAHAAVKRHGINVGMISMEMPKVQYGMRLLSMQARIDSQRLKIPNSMSDREWRDAMDGLGKLSEMGIYIDDTSGLTISEIKARARRFATRHDLGMLFIDYIQLASGENGARDNGNRNQEVSAISRGLKELARELDIPVFGLSQLNRAVESRPNKRPNLSDLRESGSLEQDADVVMFLYRDEYYDPASEDAGVAEIIVAKQRSGPTGTVKVAWVDKYTTFEDLGKAIPHGQPA